MRGLAVAALAYTVLLGCVPPQTFPHVLPHPKSCVPGPPPTLEDHKKMCDQFDVDTQMAEAFNCGLKRFSMFITETRLWTVVTYDRCGRGQ